jgi:hypothetical protein
LKFERRAATIHAYLFQEAGLSHAAIYVTTDRGTSEAAARQVSGPDEASVEQQVRDWVDEQFPRRS